MLDLRNIGSRERYCDVYTLYPSDAVDGNTLKLKDDAVPLARVHSHDVEEFRYERPTVNGYVSTVVQYRGVIESMDDLSMARPDMFAVAEDGTIFIIEAPLITKNDSAVTALSRRPNIKYVMTLRGIAE